MHNITKNLRLCSNLEVIGYEIISTLYAGSNWIGHSALSIETGKRHLDILHLSFPGYLNTYKIHTFH